MNGVELVPGWVVECRDLDSGEVHEWGRFTFYDDALVCWRRFDEADAPEGRRISDFECVLEWRSERWSASC